MTVATPATTTPARPPHTIRMHVRDNVAIVANDGGLPAGTVLPSGLVLGLGGAHAGQAFLVGGVARQLDELTNRGHRGVDGGDKKRVVGGPGNRQVEPYVFVRARFAAFHRGIERLERQLQRLQVIGIAKLGRPGGSTHFHAAAEGVITLDVGQAFDRCGRHHRCTRGTDDGAACTTPRVDDAVRTQPRQCLAHGGPRHAELRA